MPLDPIPAFAQTHPAATRSSLAAMPGQCRGSQTAGGGLLTTVAVRFAGGGIGSELTILYLSCSIVVQYLLIFFRSYIFAV